MKQAEETRAVPMKRQKDKQGVRRGIAWLLSLCFMLALCPAGQAATVEELTAQLDAVRTELAAVKSQLARDYPNCTSVNGQVVSRSPLVVKGMWGDYYMVNYPVADGYKLLGGWYHSYHKLTGNTTVVYDNGVPHNATVVGTGYPQGKELNVRRAELEQQEAELESELETEKLFAPVYERNNHLNALACVRQPGVRLVFKVGNPYMIICGEARDAQYKYDAYNGGYQLDGKQVFYMMDDVDEQKGYDYGAYIEDGNLNAMPVVIDGSTMIPVRPLIEWLGGTVDWDSQTNVIECKLDRNTISTAVGSSAAYVNGVLKEMPVPVTVYGGKTVIPLRFISENLGRRVEWIQGGQYIQVYDKEEVVTLPPAPVATPAPVTTPAPSEVKQEPDYDWSSFVGDWVCEEKGYHLYIPDGGDSIVSDGVFWCDELGEDVKLTIGFVLSYRKSHNDFEIYGSSELFGESNSLVSLTLVEPSYNTMHGRIEHDFDGEWGSYPVVFRAVESN